MCDSGEALQHRISPIKVDIIQRHGTELDDHPSEYFTRFISGPVNLSGSGVSHDEKQNTETLRVLMVSRPVFLTCYLIKFEN